MSHWHLRQASALRSSTLRSPTSFRESADYGHCWCYCVHDDCVCDREYDGYEYDEYEYVNSLWAHTCLIMALSHSFTRLFVCSSPFILACFAAATELRVFRLQTPIVTSLVLVLLEALLN